MTQRILFSLFFLLLTTVVYSQFPQNPRNQKLGYSTTADYLVYLSDSIPSHTPSTIYDASVALDTANSILYIYDYQQALWIRTNTTVGSSFPTDENQKYADFIDSSDSTTYFYNRVSNSWTPYIGGTGVTGQVVEWASPTTLTSRALWNNLSSSHVPYWDGSVFQDYSLVYDKAGNVKANFNDGDEREWGFYTSLDQGFLTGNAYYDGSWRSYENDGGAGNISIQDDGSGFLFNYDNTVTGADQVLVWDVQFLMKGDGLFVLPSVSSTTGEAGGMYYDSDDNRLKLHDGTDFDAVLTDDQVNSDNYIPRSTGSAFENSVLYQDDAGELGLNQTSPNATFHMEGDRGMVIPLMDQRWWYAYDNANLAEAFTTDQGFMGMSTMWDEDIIEINSYEGGTTDRAYGLYSMWLKNPSNTSFVWRDSIYVTGHVTDVLPAPVPYGELRSVAVGAGVRGLEHNDEFNDAFYSADNHFLGFEGTANFASGGGQDLYFVDDQSNTIIHGFNFSTNPVQVIANGTVVNQSVSWPAGGNNYERIFGVQLIPEEDSVQFYWYTYNDPNNRTIIGKWPHNHSDLWMRIRGSGGLNTRASWMLHAYRFYKNFQEINLGEVQVTGGSDGNGIYDGSGSLSGNTTVTASTNLLDISGTAAFGLPSGTTAQQPSAGTAGRIRWNTDNTYLELDNGTSWEQVPRISDIYDGWFLSADGGASTQITDAETVNFEDSGFINVFRSLNNIWITVTAKLDTITNGNDLSISAATLNASVNYTIFARQESGSPASDIVITLPTPSASYDINRIIVIAEDDDATFDITLSSGVNEIWDAGSLTNSVTISNHSVIEIVVALLPGGSHKWIIK